MAGSTYRAIVVLVFASVVGSACTATAPTPSQSSGQQAQPQPPSPSRHKVLNVAVTGGVQAMSIAGSSSPTGGFFPFSEIHSDGLVTADVTTHKAVGRLAERVPTVDDGSVSMLPDGRMRVVFPLRKGVTWHDGAPFTARDMVFAFAMGGPDGFPTALNTAAEHIASVEAPDDYTFIVNYKQPYYLATSLGPNMLWPLPQHLLQETFDRYLASRNADEVLQNPYWTTGYVHLGAFRLTQFDPGQGFTFEANDRYYLGRPRIDTIRVTIFGDQNTLLASVLAGAIDLVPESAMREATGVPLRDQWKVSGEGTVHVQQASLRRLVHQVRPELQSEPANLDPRVRTALYHALDREDLADAVGGGNRQFAAWSFLPTSDPNYDATRDALRPFAYNPDRSRAILRDLGWSPGADGILRNNSDGRPYHTAIWTNPDADREIAAYAAYWRAIGLEVEEFTIGSAQSRDPAARSQFPGWEVTSGDIVDAMAQPAASAQNRWIGNRSGYEDPRARSLVLAFQSSITQAEQLRTMRAVNDFVVSDVLSLFTFFNAHYIGARKGIKAFDDIAGGDNSAIYGSYYRNSHLWDID